MTTLISLVMSSPDNSSSVADAALRVLFGTELHRASRSRQRVVGPSSSFADDTLSSIVVRHGFLCRINHWAQLGDDPGDIQARLFLHLAGKSVLRAPSSNHLPRLSHREAQIRRASKPHERPFSKAECAASRECRV
ncbi:hypothetical protein J3458_000438 [Metarhizium acridum]|uniref:uncharacterized protein n=1 Tax=Metarhizium acridum TaxID=92637 RepID=UPI001C6C2E94|nr:hypothetical protein J3458_000438 [Metarhizium acridum]